MTKKKVSAREFRRRKSQSEQGEVIYKNTPDGLIKFTKVKDGYQVEWIDEEISP